MFHRVPQERSIFYFPARTVVTLFSFRHSNFSSINPFPGCSPRIFCATIEIFSFFNIISKGIFRYYAISNTGRRINFLRRQMIKDMWFWMNMSNQRITINNSGIIYKCRHFKQTFLRFNHSSNAYQYDCHKYEIKFPSIHIS